MAIINIIGTEIGDFLYGDAGGTYDTYAIFGGNGSDRIHGGDGNDRIYGEEGNDFLEGGYGSDTLSGGNGNDYLTGQNQFSNFLASPSDFEKDTLYGGGGADIFFLHDISGNSSGLLPSPRIIPGSLLYANDGDADYAIIKDFKSGEDKIQLPGNASRYQLLSSGNSTRIYEDNGNFSEDEFIATVENTSGLSLDSSDFVFV